MTKKLDYDRAALQADVDAALLSSALAALDLQPKNERDFFVTMDGTSRPFFGLSYRGGKKTADQDDREFTMAGRWTEGAIKGGQREYRGTANKHPYFQMNMHFYTTLTSHPLGIRPGRVTLEGIVEFLAILDKLPSKPRFILADKEFCNSPKLDKLRPWCDANGVILLLPYRKDARVTRLIKKLWHDGIAKPMNHSPEGAYWAVTRWAWPKRDARPFNLITVYLQGEPRQELKEEAAEILRLPNGWFAVSFYTNIEVTEDNVYALTEQYSKRWSCENLHKRHKAYCGRSYSHGMFLRDFTYMASMIILAAYSLWRLHRQHRRGLRRHHPKLGIRRYLGDLNETCKDGLRSKYLKVERLQPPRLEAPPVPKPPPR